LLLRFNFNIQGLGDLRGLSETMTCLKRDLKRPATVSEVANVTSRANICHYVSIVDSRLIQRAQCRRFVRSVRIAQKVRR
jgi:hypothetical protein